MAIVVIRNDEKTPQWVSLLQAQDPEIPVYAYGPAVPRKAITMAAVWKHPQGSTAEFPNLKGIHGLGAGVDFILEDPDRDPALPVMRVVDPYLASDMAEYILALVMSHLRQLPEYGRDKANSAWHPRPYNRIANLRVGIMGLGQLGMAVARLLAKTGFPLSGWARTPKPDPGFPVFHGAAGQAEFLSGCDVLVCLLPLTPATRGILDRKLFSNLPAGALMINVARGPLLEEADLLLALDAGNLSAAWLDVFHEEPLPAGHPFWKHPRVNITPHIASVSDPASVAGQIITNYKALMTGAPLRHQVDLQRGY
ncbi:glyoxylate/hydroxypyruvate reductase A [Robiginitalea sp. M366]|uniref:2-hydroxyacid dehydrogenase n=1 Tax=Robiginitalea aestuariiviva TaxID=3036903 RepID=UPI00240DC52B|nr:glyoxylate/hydroxypyruvate reductase A [Robiginitalea aestuariiviva]MDG1572936.1 glyoxylate/hydroxypyruvate reductase A [Robiginitalea aestuariiviva]